MSGFAYLALLWTWQFWISLFAILLIRSIIQIWSLRKRMPPGPLPLPLLGNLLAFRGAKVGSHEIMVDLAKKYGDPMTVFCGPKPAVILTKYETIKSVMQQTAFSSRVDSAALNLIMDEIQDRPPAQDILFGKYGPLWQLHRRLTTKCIRFWAEVMHNIQEMVPSNFRSIIDAEKLEGKVLEAVDLTVEAMLKHPENVEPVLHISHIVFNILASFAFGQTYKIDDPEFLLLEDLSERGKKEFVKFLFLDFLPFAKYFLPLMKWLPVVKSALTIAKDFKALRARQIEEHRRTFSEGDPRDFCDAILQEQELLKKEGQAEQLTDDHVSFILLDFFNAGTDTTTSVLTWFVLYMVMYPEIQEECCQEIEGAIGDRHPRISDRPKLQFVEACIMETLRLRPPAPMSVPHAPVGDAKIGDYIIPEGTITMPNLHAMHVDPEYWDRPQEFNPRLHLLDENGQLRKPPSFGPFGFGRRACLGEQLARNDMLLVIVRLLQNVRFEAIDGVEYTQDYEISLDLSYIALPFSVRISPRK